MSLRRFLRLFPVVPVAFVAIAAGGCSHRGDGGDAEHASIKDNAARAEAPRTLAPQPPVRRTAANEHRPIRLSERKPHSAAIARVGNDAPRPSSLNGPSSAVDTADGVPPVAPKVLVAPKAAKVASVPVQTTPQMPAPVQTAPPAVVKMLPKPAPVAVAVPAEKTAPTPEPAKPAAAPLTQPAAAAMQPAATVPAEPKVELIPAPKASIPAPAQQAAVAPAAKIPAPAKTDADIAAGGRPATSKAPQAVPSTTKVASLTEQTRVRDALDRADAYMKNGQIINARALLQDASRGENPDLLAALAATYDPVVLVDYPAVQKAADAKRAAELYDNAIGKGSVAAKDRLAKLKVYIERAGR